MKLKDCLVRNSSHYVFRLSGVESKKCKGAKTEERSNLLPDTFDKSCFWSSGQVIGIIVIAYNSASQLLGLCQNIPIHKKLSKGATINTYFES